jgi:hypothetical protein
MADTRNGRQLIDPKASIAHRQLSWTIRVLFTTGDFFCRAANFFAFS